MRVLIRGIFGSEISVGNIGLSSFVGDWHMETRVALHTVITTQLARGGRRRWRAHTQARLGLGSLSRLPPSSNPPPPETQSGGRCVFYLLVSRSPASSRWSLWSRHVSTSILVHPSHRQQRRKGCSLSRGTPQKRNPFPRHSAKENQTSYPCCP